MRKKRRKTRHFRNRAFLQLLGAHCRRLRNGTGISVNRMARESSRLSASVIMRLEKGTGPVTVLTLLRYADGLGVPVKRLFDFPFDWHEYDEGT